MRRFYPLTIGALVVVASQWATAATESADSVAAATKVRYQSGKEVRFDELLIQGRMKRAEMSVVTGDPGELSDGLLRLRENFLDHAALDIGEEIP